MNTAKINQVGISKYWGTVIGVFVEVLSTLIIVTTVVCGIGFHIDIARQINAGAGEYSWFLWPKVDAGDAAVFILFFIACISAALLSKCKARYLLAILLLPLLAHLYIGIEDTRWVWVPLDSADLAFWGLPVAGFVLARFIMRRKLTTTTPSAK